MKKIIKLIVEFLLTGCILAGGQTVYAEDLLEDLDFTEVEQMLDETLEEDISFEQMVRDLISGKLPIQKKTILSLIERMFFTEIKANSACLVYVLLIAVMAAALTNFTRVFERSQTADISFYIVYVLLLAVLIQSFRNVHTVAGGIIGQMSEFMKLLMPTYMLTVAVAKGGSSAVVFYELLLGMIYGVTVVLFRILLPLCNVYVVLNLVNYISKEDMLSKTADLIKTLVQWGLKTMLAVVIGLNVVQGLITPAVDSFKAGAVHRAVSAVPGIGNTMNAVTEVVIGSGMLIKNGVGVGILIVLVLLCLVPLVKMVVFLLLYKVAAAVIQPISDKRMIHCISTVGEGSRLLLKCVTTTLTLFFITIAILTVSTSMNYL